MINLNHHYLNEPTKTINYFSCHDGYTLMDRIKVSTNDFIKEKVKLCFAVLFISPGVPFFQGGDEFLRTKYFESNSYNSPDKINGFDYKLLEINSDVVYYVYDLIHLRKEHCVFRINKRQDYLTALHIVNNYYYQLNYENKVYHILFKLSTSCEEHNFAQEVINIHNPNGNCKIMNYKFKVNNIGLYIYTEELICLK